MQSEQQEHPVHQALMFGDLMMKGSRVFLKELDISKLVRYEDHHRLGTFQQFGCRCANPACDRVGTRLVVTADKGAGTHVDLFTDDLALMTVDHIIPKSIGGPDEFINKQPMCLRCNQKKAHKPTGAYALGMSDSEFEVFVDVLSMTPECDRDQMIRDLLFERRTATTYTLEATTS